MAAKSESSWIDLAVEELKRHDVAIPDDLAVIATRPEHYQATLQRLPATELLDEIRSLSLWVANLDVILPEVRPDINAPVWARLVQASNQAILFATQVMQSRLADALGPVAIVTQHRAFDHPARNVQRRPVKKTTAKAAAAKGADRKAAAKAAPTKAAARKAATKAAPTRAAAKKTTTKGASTNAAAKKTTATKSAERGGATRARRTVTSHSYTPPNGKKTTKKSTEIKPVKPPPGTAWGQKKKR